MHRGLICFQFRRAVILLRLYRLVYAKNYLFSSILKKCMYSLLLNTFTSQSFLRFKPKGTSLSSSAKLTQPLISYLFINFDTACSSYLCV